MFFSSDVPAAVRQALSQYQLAANCYFAQKGQTGNYFHSISCKGAVFAATTVQQQRGTLILKLAAHRVGRPLEKFSHCPRFLGLCMEMAIRLHMHLDSTHLMKSILFHILI